MVIEKESNVDWKGKSELLILVHSYEYDDQLDRSRKQLCFTVRHSQRLQAPVEGSIRLLVPLS
ncbi:hypothetical protein SPOG_02666 [Schizosaccharomyces cryophilus OY26]|uniref:Uncharacterized protein n=1 Tax=Schizosaccharomyces cryophilus (strain OY26 / ATCC MYA-4695 / CBS 11777 / NBRC 106824 / NRRL Y48691) TaxID=653667 RepID=S9W0A7_SCHCR|nr:uncharacterized protein SPOG_02666 [Schizosaccharomyces cryophilus OY26]EPY51495.1 hypothetical protein SPOG_02666 [Schizosaccharomyces cryophilus OY26]